MTTFIIPDYTIGNSADCQVQAIGVLQGLDQALQSLQPAPNATTVQFNDTILLTDGVTSNTLDNTGYTTKNSVQNSTHYLNFSDNSGTGLGPIQKTAGIICNPSTKTLAVTAGISQVTLSPSTITNTDIGVGSSTYIPSLILQANSNNDVPITPIATNPHQVILQSGPVPLIDTLDPVTWTLPSGETFNTYSYDSGHMYIGCESGNVYWFDTSTDTWTLQATFDGAVRCIYWHSPSGKLYIGGNFDNISYPLIQTGLNKVCYNTGPLPTFNTIGVDVWSNIGVNGFDKEVNAIVGDNDNLYFGGKFEFTTGGTYNCRFIATFNWSSTGNLYALDNNVGNGFDNIVWSLALTSFYLCVAGDFQNITTNSGTSSAQFCCQLTISGTTFTVAQVDFLYGTSIALSNPISSTEKVQTDGSNFYISTADSNINGAGQNYFIGTALGNSFPSVFQVGNNDATVQQQFTLQGSVSSVGSNNVYLQNNTTVATLPFASYLYWNSFYNRIEFIDLATGTIYAFIGSTTNRFTFQSGRYLEQQGTQYTGGVSLSPSGTGYGFTEVLLWNGTYYTPTWILGGTPFN